MAARCYEESKLALSLPHYPRHLQVPRLLLGPAWLLEALVTPDSLHMRKKNIQEHVFSPFEDSPRVLWHTPLTSSVTT